MSDHNSNVKETNIVKPLRFGFASGVGGHRTFAITQSYTYGVITPSLQSYDPRNLSAQCDLSDSVCLSVSLSLSLSLSLPLSD